MSWCFANRNYFFIACLVLLLFLLHVVTCSFSEELRLQLDDSDSKSVVLNGKRVKKQVNSDSQVSSFNVTDNGNDIEFGSESEFESESESNSVDGDGIGHENGKGAPGEILPGQSATSNSNSSATLPIVPSKASSGKGTMTVTATRIGTTRYFSPSTPYSVTEETSSSTPPLPNNMTLTTEESSSTGATTTIFAEPYTQPSVSSASDNEEDDEETDEEEEEEDAGLNIEKPEESESVTPDSVHPPGKKESEKADEEEQQEDEDEADSLSQENRLDSDSISAASQSTHQAPNPNTNTDMTKTTRMKTSTSTTTTTDTTATATSTMSTPTSTFTPTGMVDSTSSRDADADGTIGREEEEETENKQGNGDGSSSRVVDEMTEMPLNMHKAGDSLTAHNDTENEMEIEMSDWDLLKPVNLNDPPPYPTNPDRMSRKDGDNQLAQELLPHPVPLVGSGSGDAHHTNNRHINQHHDGPHEEDFADAFSRNAGHPPVKTRRRRLRTNNSNNDADNININHGPGPHFRRRVKKMRTRKTNETSPHSFYPGENEHHAETFHQFTHQSFGLDNIHEPSEMNSFNVHTHPETQTESSSHINQIEDTMPTEDGENTHKTHGRIHMRRPSKLHENLTKLSMSQDRPRMRRFRSTTTTTAASTTTTIPTTTTSPNNHDGNPPDKVKADSSTITPIVEIDSDFVRTPAFVSDLTITEVPPPSFVSFPNSKQSPPSIRPILLKSPQIINYGVDPDGNPEYIITATEHPEPQIERPNTDPFGYTEKTNVNFIYPENAQESHPALNSIHAATTTTTIKIKDGEKTSSTSTTKKKKKKVKGKVEDVPLPIPTSTAIPLPIPVPSPSPSPAPGPSPVFVPSSTIIPPVSASPSKVHNNESGEWLHSDHSTHDHHYNHHAHHKPDFNEVMPGHGSNNMLDMEMMIPGDFFQGRDQWEKNYMNLQQHSFKSGEEMQQPMPIPGQSFRSEIIGGTNQGPNDKGNEAPEVIIHNEPTKTTVVEHHYDAMGVEMPGPPPESMDEKPPQTQIHGPVYSGSHNTNKLTIGGGNGGSRSKSKYNSGERRRRPSIFNQYNQQKHKQQHTAHPIDGGEQQQMMMIPFTSPSSSSSSLGSSIREHGQNAISRDPNLHSNANALQIPGFYPEHGGGEIAGYPAGVGTGSSSSSSASSISSSSGQAFNPYHTSMDPSAPPFLPHFDTPITENPVNTVHQSSHYDRTKQKYIIHPETHAALKPVLADMDTSARGKSRNKNKHRHSHSGPSPSSTPLVNPNTIYPELPTPLKLTSAEKFDGKNRPIHSAIEDHFNSMRDSIIFKGQGPTPGSNGGPGHGSDSSNDVNGGFPSPFKVVGAPQSYQQFSVSPSGPPSVGVTGGSSLSGERGPKYLESFEHSNSNTAPSGPLKSGDFSSSHGTIIHHHYHDGTLHDNPPPPLTLPMPGLVHVPTPPTESQAMNEVTSHAHYPPHTHSMSSQSDFEPANPPLPSGQHHYSDQHFDHFVQNAGDFKASPPDSSIPPPQQQQQQQQLKYRHQSQGQGHRRPGPSKSKPSHYNSNTQNKYNDIIILKTGSSPNDFQDSNNALGGGINSRPPLPQPPPARLPTPHYTSQGQSQSQSQSQIQSQGHGSSSGYPGIPGETMNSYHNSVGADYTSNGIAPGEPFDFGHVQSPPELQSQVPTPASLYGEGPSQPQVYSEQGETSMPYGGHQQQQQEGGQKPEEEIEDPDTEVEVTSPYSETPYVIMFPNLIPPAKKEQQSSRMPPIPGLGLGGIATVLPLPLTGGHTKDTPFASASEHFHGPEKLLGPGMRVVPVHPRIQMLKALANKEYQAKLEALQEKAKKPPSAIYTPYGVLIPMRYSPSTSPSYNGNSNGGDSNSGGSSTLSAFVPPPPPPPPTITVKRHKNKQKSNRHNGKNSNSNPISSGSKKSNSYSKYPTDQKSLLNVLLGSKIGPIGHFDLNSKLKMKGSKLTKEMGLKASVEPAMDLLAEKLAIKLSALEYLITHPPKKLGVHVSSHLHPPSPSPSPATHSHSAHSSLAPAPTPYGVHHSTSSDWNPDASYSELKPVKTTATTGPGPGREREREQGGNKRNGSKTPASSSSSGNGNRNGKESRNDKGIKPFASTSPSASAPLNTVNKLKVVAPAEHSFSYSEDSSSFSASSPNSASSVSGRKKEDEGGLLSSSPSPIFSNYLKSLLKERLFEMLEESWLDPNQQNPEADEESQGDGDDDDGEKVGGGEQKKKSKLSKKRSGVEEGVEGDGVRKGKTSPNPSPLPIPSHPFQRKDEPTSYFGPAPAPALQALREGGSKIQFGPFTFPTLNLSPNRQRQNKNRNGNTNNKARRGENQSLNPNPNPNPNQNQNQNSQSNHLNNNEPGQPSNSNSNSKSNANANSNVNNNGNNQFQEKHEKPPQQSGSGGFLSAIRRLFTFGAVGQNQNRHHNQNQNHQGGGGSNMNMNNRLQHANNGSLFRGGRNQRGGSKRMGPWSKNQQQQNQNSNQHQNQYSHRQQPQHPHHHQQQHNEHDSKGFPFSSIKSAREIEKMLQHLLKNSPFHPRDEAISSSFESGRTNRGSHLNPNSNPAPNSSSQQQQDYQPYSYQYSSIPNKNMGNYGNSNDPHSNSKGFYHSYNNKNEDSSSPLKMIPSPQLSPSTFLPLESSSSSGRSSGGGGGTNSQQMSKRKDDGTVESPLSLVNNYPFNLLPSISEWKPMPTNSKADSAQDSSSPSLSQPPAPSSSSSSASSQFVIQKFTPFPTSSSSKETDGENDSSVSTINSSSATDDNSNSNNNSSSIDNNNNNNEIKSSSDNHTKSPTPDQSSLVSTPISPSTHHKIQPRSV